MLGCRLRNHPGRPLPRHPPRRRRCSLLPPLCHLPPPPAHLQIFQQLAQLAPVATPEEADLYDTRRLPFRTFDFPGETHPGLRAYPFLAQVWV